jgi:hypothetical protein
MAVGSAALTAVVVMVGAAVAPGVGDAAGVDVHEVAMTSSAVANTRISA